MAQFKGNSNIVSYEDHMTVPHDDGKGWDILIRMELLTSLPEYFKMQTIKDRDVIRLGIDICSALELCADRKIIHRDIKPQNIFINDFGNYKLGDFGIARMIDHTTVVSKAFSPDYVSPELYSGRPVSAASDIYSLALVMYWLLNERRLPFLPLPPVVPKHTELESAKQRRLSGEKIPEPENGSAELKSIILKALSYSPEDRYVSASEMKAELQNIFRKRDDKQDRPSDTPGLTSNKQEHSFQNNYFVHGGDLSQQNEMYKGMKETQNEPNNPSSLDQRSNYGWDNEDLNTDEDQTVKVNRIAEKYKEDFPGKQYEEEEGASVIEDPGDEWRRSEPVKKKEKPILIILITAIAVMLCISFFILFQRGCGGSKAADEPVTRSESSVENEDDEPASRSESNVESNDEEVKAESGSAAQEERKKQAAGELSEADVQKKDEAQASEESDDADADSSDKTSSDIPDNPAAKKYLEPEKANQTITEKGEYNGRYTVSTYDEKGAITESSRYFWDDTLEYRTVYQRDENGAPLHFDRYSDGDLLTAYGNNTLDANGFLASMKIYDEEDTLTQESHFTNDAEGNCLTEEIHVKKGSYYRFTEYEIDEYGNAIKAKEFDRKKNLTRTGEYEYSDPENGTLLKTTYYNRDGSLQSVSEYNEDGEEIHYIYYSSYDKGSYQERKTDYSEEGLITGSEYRYYDSSGKMEWYELDKYNEKGGHTKTERYSNSDVLERISEFNISGNEVKSTDYNKGKVTYYTERIYDDKGDLTESNRYHANGSLSYQTLYQDGRQIKSNSYGDSGNLYDYTEYVYDENGEYKESTTYHADGSLSYQTLYQDGNQIKYSSYDENGHLDYFTEYTYDSQGNKKEEVSYYADGSIKSRTTYKDGDRTETVYYRVDGSVEHRNLYIDDELSKGIWYDEAGNITRETTY